MNSITSEDGTQIAYEKSGSGPSLVIVGGALGDHNFYAPLAAQLERSFTVFNVDRRGRGESGDTLPYSVAREVEDIAAIIDVAGEPAVIYGHSAGSALALRAAAAGLPIVKLILADPPYMPHSDNDNAAIAQFADEKAKVQELHDRGDHRGNAARFLGGFGLSEDDVDGMLDSPAGTGMIDSAKALPYDYAVLGNGLVPTHVAEQINVPVVILSAGNSLDAAKELEKSMPHAALQRLSSDTHEMSPDALADRVKEVSQ